MSIQINTRAPAQYTESITINAPIQTVWGVLSAIDKWPAWNPDIQSVNLLGPVEVGTMFIWKSGPSKITSLLEEVSVPHSIAWTGKTMGIKAVHTYTLVERDGQTIVTTAESFEGLIVKLFKNMMVNTMAKSGHTGLEHLKNAAEKSQQSV